MTSKGPCQPKAFCDSMILSFSHLIPRGELCLVMLADINVCIHIHKYVIYMYVYICLFIYIHIHSYVAFFPTTLSN